MKQVRLEGSPITYYVDGEEKKEGVLFLHAAFVDHGMFRVQADYFKERYRVLVPDLIGHGSSTDTKKGDRIDKMPMWISEILKKEKLCRAHIVGVSLGAVLAQDFANRYPEAVQSLACFGGYDINRFDKNLQKKNSMAQMGMMAKAVFSIKWFARSNKKISACTAQAQNEFYEMNLRFPKRSFRYLASLNTVVNVHPAVPRDYPLLIGCGQYDVPAELSAVEQWKKDEPDCRMVVVEGAGHCVNMDAPEKFNHILEEFWGGTGAR